MATALLPYKHDHPCERFTVVSEPVRCLNKEKERLETFDFCTSSEYIHRHKVELARWGFYYFRQPDVARCYFCKIELANWQHDDVVTQEHLRWSPYCPLMKKRPTDNVPIVENFLDQLADVVSDVTGTTDETSNTGSALAVSIQPPTIEPIALAEDSVPTYNPKHPIYKLEVERLASFKQWPKSMKQTPAQMADAGFFYTGNGDIVQCFCCGGALSGWLSEDDPWVEHATHYSGCFYVNLMKSVEFIRDCQAKQAMKDNGQETCTQDVEPAAPEAELGDDKCCKICYARPYDTIFMPCRHVAACGKCAVATTRCPFCNEPYSNIMHIYLP